MIAIIICVYIYIYVCMCVCVYIYIYIGFEVWAFRLACHALLRLCDSGFIGVTVAGCDIRVHTQVSTQRFEFRVLGQQTYKQVAKTARCRVWG